MKRTLKYFDVVYTTKSGRAMVAKRVQAFSKTGAMTKVKNEMRASTTFKKCVMAFEL